MQSAKMKSSLSLQRPLRTPETENPFIKGTPGVVVWGMFYRNKDQVTSYTEQPIQHCTELHAGAKFKEYNAYR